MKRKSLCILMVLILAAMSSLFADRVTLRDGTVHQGVILGADALHVNFKPLEGEEMAISHAQIDSLTFDMADVVHLVSGETIPCKIISKEFPELDVATPEGLRSIPMTTLIRYYYNTASQVTIPRLPPTTDDFHNSLKGRVEITGKWLGFGLNFGMHLPPKHDWEDHFIRPASIAGFVGSVRGQYGLSPRFSLGAGADFFHYAYDPYQGLKSAISSYYIYGSVELALKKSPRSWYVGLDGGFMLGRGNVYMHSFRNVEFDESSFAFRPRIGVRQKLSGQVCVFGEASMLLASLGPVNTGVPGLDEISVDLNGLALSFGFTYLIPQGNK